jgi:hypothetical protein
MNRDGMARIRSKELAEAEELLAALDSWSAAEIDALPQFYREKAQEYRQLTNRGTAEL